MKVDFLKDLINETYKIINVDTNNCVGELAINKTHDKQVLHLKKLTAMSINELNSLLEQIKISFHINKSEDQILFT